MKRKDIAFEESLSQNWSEDLDVVEIPLEKAPMTGLWIVLLLIGSLVGGRLIYLGVIKNNVYAARADANLHYIKHVSAPRGLILDRYGKVIADNRVVFRAFLDVREYIRKKDLQEPTLKAVRDILGAEPQTVVDSLKDKKGLNDFTLPLALSTDLTQAQLLQLKSLNLSTILIENGYVRSYPQGQVFSSVLGYVSMAGPNDLKKNPKLTSGDFVGKSGIESFYDETLHGTAGKIIEFRNAKGELLGKEEKVEPSPAPSLKTTLDAEFQEFFYNRLDEGLKSLGRTSGAGLAFNPKTGEVLAMISMPSYDGNAFTTSGRNGEVREFLNSPNRPLFNRAVSGIYAPGSTIKPLVGVAALKEGVISPTKTIFSPGYLEIPNPYNPSKPTRYPDWTYQGDVNLYSAIAQSSNVYFYSVGGGTENMRGLGAKRLREWWEKFNLGSLTGIDLPGEKEGFLPSPEWKEKRTKTPWLLGDTYNVSIGQGDVQITPIQLLSYIGAIANGGKVYSPHIGANMEPKILKDLSYLLPEIKEVQRGMIQTVKGAKGTAKTMADLPFIAAGKTGSAQIDNNTKENAFFVGYAPADDPQISVLVLVENSKQGSLNAVPIAKDVLNWYYEHRLNDSNEEIIN